MSEATGGGRPDDAANTAAPAPSGAANHDEHRTVSIPIAGTTIGFSVRLGGDGPAYFSLGVRKSGSTMLHRIVSFLAARNRINVVDAPSTFFRNGFTVADWQDQDLSALLAHRNCYVGFRTFPELMSRSEVYAGARKVFMFRDPRDVLVSQYFSDAYSHTIPAEGSAGSGRELFLQKRQAAQAADIDEWVLGRVGGIKRTMLAYRPALEDPLCLVLRYEEFVFQKRRLVAKILRHFGWQVDPGPLNAFLGEIDVVPPAEDATRFIRKVIPGDHIAKLKPETIRRLNHRLAEILEIYDYY